MHIKRLHEFFFIKLYIVLLLIFENEMCKYWINTTIKLSQKNWNNENSIWCFKLNYYLKFIWNRREWLGC